MKLLLTSGGIVPEIKKDFFSLLNTKPSDCKIVLVNTAIYGEELTPKDIEDYKESTSEQLRNCGITQIEEIDLRKQTPQSLSLILNDKDILVINGGNTFYLLYWIKKNKLDSVIKEQLQRGLVYVGISAGSYIACPTIEAAGWKNQDKNRIRLKDLIALNLVDFLIMAHYSENYKPILEKEIKTTKFPMVALTDEQAILVKDSRIRLVGEKTKTFYNGFREN